MPGEKRIYFFGSGKAEGSADMRNLLGGKGANLAEMTNMGVPVPAGFTITTEVCTEYGENNGELPEGLWGELESNIKKTEEAMNAKFGDSKNPLLIAVRSGARVSMPGMMDTVLNLGLNDETVKGIAEQSGNERFAYDSYRRFINMYGEVVLGVEHKYFEELIQTKKSTNGKVNDTELTAGELQELVEEYKALVKRETGESFPTEPKEQLKKAICAVFGSWDTERAAIYRRINGIPGDWGTAVNVMAMVYGNLGDDSGTGVAFTRDPSTGEKVFYGEYLLNAQGEDVVAGIRTPQPINEARKASEDDVSLEKKMPSVYKELVGVYKKLEKHYRDVQDIEFTIQKGILFLLQTRTAKRTAAAAVKIAVDLVSEGLIDSKEAILRLDPSQLDQLLHPMVDPQATNKVIAKGLAASPGAAKGSVVFSAESAVEEAEKGNDVILVRNETSPEDIGGMNAARGILTARGGMTSHAAVVARGMGKCCVAGCGAVVVHEEARCFSVGELTVAEGERITINGTTGEVLLGDAETVQPELGSDFKQVMVWADEYRKLKIRTNADTPHDAQVAREFGAEGIGLCRTEHMFFGDDRLPIVREMIMAKSSETRKEALRKLLPMQRSDFKGIFEAMKGMPVTIRLLDPPLHEFLPNAMDLSVEIAECKLELKDAGSFPEIDQGIRKINERTSLLETVSSLHETNPMLGHRGCRLGITYPEIYRMQVRAIFEAACDIYLEQGAKIVPEVMIPLVGHVNELRFTRKHAIEVANEVMKNKNVKLDYMLGTMIEVPRAALTADIIAKEADFFSFGTNDLTQMAFGFSRDDIAMFLPGYIENKILPCDPFVALDQEGVGLLVKMAVEKGRATRPDLKLGICGEHGGEPTSVEFCHRIGLDYVSCSPFRVPIARLAAAQAVLR